MKVWELLENEYYTYTIPESKVYKMIREYYKNEGFNGRINFIKYIYSVPDGFGYSDDHGSMKIQFINKVTILDQTKYNVKEISAYDIDFEEIFSPVFEETEYEIFSDGTHKPYFNFKIINPQLNELELRNLTLYVKRKNKERVLKK